MHASGDIEVHNSIKFMEPFPLPQLDTTTSKVRVQYNSDGSPKVEPSRYEPPPSDHAHVGDKHDGGPLKSDNDDKARFVRFSIPSLMPVFFLVFSVKLYRK